ncbi:MAG: hypothetical protein JNL38_02445 [Myxococcales bacterium]|jgi:hypothetical protein|nr:hypothetical protein [Myxococcales bacterium]
MRQTKVDQALAAAEEMFEGDPQRAEVIARARRFKASWVELAEALSEVRQSGRYRDWGYETFEAYALKELHLKQETVDKLTGSYAFLRKRAPEVLSRDGVNQPIPTYHAIDFLRRAEEKEDAPEEVVGEIRKRVIDDCATAPQITKQFKETIFPVSDAERKKRDAAGLKNVGTRLRDLLAETQALPRKVAVETKDAIDRMLEALDAEKKKDDDREERAA